MTKYTFIFGILPLYNCAMKILAAAICLISAAVFMCFPTAEARAASRGWGRAEADDAYFCARKDRSSALFTIPETYCAEILGEEDGWYYVRYAEDDGVYKSLYGYVRAEKLTVLSDVPETPFLHYTVPVEFTPPAPPNGLSPLEKMTVSAAYYGGYVAGDAAYSYVYYANAFGYVQGSYDDFPRIHAPSLPASGGEVSETPASDKVNVKLIVGIAVGVAALGAIAALYFTGRKNYVRRRKQ